MEEVRLSSHILSGKLGVNVPFSEHKFVKLLTLVLFCTSLGDKSLDTSVEETVSLYVKAVLLLLLGSVDLSFARPSCA